MSSFYKRPWATSMNATMVEYAVAENPLKRGSARTTPWRPRGTISSVPPGSKNGGYVVPQYVLKERVGSHAKTTPWQPRGTVSSMKGLKTGLPWNPTKHTLDSNGLGALGASPQGGSSVGTEDPIEAYGIKAANLVVTDFASVPKGKRESELKKLLSEIDSSLYSSYKTEKRRLVGMGMGSAEAHKKGLAVAFSRGFTFELIKIGKKGKAPKPGLRKGQVSLGALMGFDAEVSNYSGLNGFMNNLRDTIKKLGGLACDVATHPVTPIAAGSAGAYFGGPTGTSNAMMGAGIAATLCSSGGGDQPVYSGGSSTPAWALPAILGGGALALVLVLRK